MAPAEPPIRRIDRPSPAAPEPEVEVAEIEEQETQSIHVPRYHVILFDDDEHTYEYVIEMLMDLFGHSMMAA